METFTISMVAIICVIFFFKFTYKILGQIEFSCTSNSECTEAIPDCINGNCVNIGIGGGVNICAPFQNENVSLFF